MVKTAPYGTWISPITASDTASGVKSLFEVEIDRAHIYWLESRPGEGGRNALMRTSLKSPATVHEVTSPTVNICTKVHEYGGGNYRVHEGVVYYANYFDQRLYAQEIGRPPRPLTTANGLRYADFEVDAQRQRVLCVREDHRAEGEAINQLVAIALTGEAEGTVLFGLSDFVSSPRLSPDGTKLAWVSWSHPNMPWDATELWVAEIALDGTLRNEMRLDPDRKQSFVEPRWGQDGTLYFASDRTGWWNLYAWDGSNTRALYPLAAEFSWPAWQFNLRSYVLLNNDTAAVTFLQDGTQRLALLDLASGDAKLIDIELASLTSLSARQEMIYGVASYNDRASEIIELTPGQNSIRMLSKPNKAMLAPNMISKAEPVTFPTTNANHAYANYYPPTNPDFQAADGELPPLIVQVHGGPTSIASSSFNLKKQYWTSRGFALLDVNYGGSSGFGRDYRERLYGNWGIVDVDDVVHGALHMARIGKADPDRLLISGGSAGGFTVLAALALKDVFSAGANYFGVADIEALAQDTHKFESRYDDQLVGQCPEGRNLYAERSPINHLDGFKAPLIVLQGLDDPVVPPNQSELIVDALRSKGVPVAYLPFAGEQHGFRKAETITRALEAELYFYGRIFGFSPADAIDPVSIDNFPE